jgi:hypothetical protein
MSNNEYRSPKFVNSLFDIRYWVFDIKTYNDISRISDEYSVPADA